MKQIITKTRSHLAILCLALFALVLASPPQALNASCWIALQPACPTEYNLDLVPPAPKPAGKYNCYGTGTYNEIQAVQQGGHSLWAPSSTDCVQNCYRTVNGVQYHYVRTNAVAGRDVGPLGGNCGGPPP